MSDGLEGVTGIEQRPITVEEAKTAKEVFVAGGSLPIMPVVQVSGRAGERAGGQAGGGCRRGVRAKVGAPTQGQKTRERMPGNGGLHRAEQHMGHGLAPLSSCAARPC